MLMLLLVVVVVVAGHGGFELGLAPVAYDVNPSPIADSSTEPDSILKDFVAVLPVFALMTDESDAEEGLKLSS